MHEILGASGLYWEIGPYLKTDYVFFALSLENSEDIIEQKKRDLGLPFFENGAYGVIGIPPKNNTTRSILLGTEEEPKRFLFSEWTYKFIEKEGQLRIGLAADEGVVVNDDLELAVKLFLVGELGEENYYRYIVGQIDYLGDQVRLPGAVAEMRKEFAHRVERCAFREFLMRD